jgi:hypothetical protein
MLWRRYYAGPKPDIPRYPGVKASRLRKLRYYLLSWTFRRRLKRWYNKDYLKSGYWLEFRRKVLARDSKKCRHCRSRKSLNIHHSPEGYRHLFRERLNSNDVITLCRECHKREHRIGWWKFLPTRLAKAA